jgi:hypothetical protein
VGIRPGFLHLVTPTAFLSKRAFAAALAFGLAACASTTRFDSTWKAPDAGPLNFQGRKVAALVISDNTSTRFSAEDLLARELKARGVEGIPAYDLIPQSETRDKDRAKALFSKAGIVGVVVMRAAGMQTEIVTSAGYWNIPSYGSFWGVGYYGYGWGIAYDGTRIHTDTIVRVETLVYDLEADKLVWAGLSESTNTSKAETLIKELVAGAVASMKKQGLIRSR